MVLKQTKIFIYFILITLISACDKDTSSPSTPTQQTKGIYEQTPSPIVNELRKTYFEKIYDHGMLSSLMKLRHKKELLFEVIQQDNIELYKFGMYGTFFSSLPPANYDLRKLWIENENSLNNQSLMGIYFCENYFPGKPATVVVNARAPVKTLLHEWLHHSFMSNRDRDVKWCDPKGQEMEKFILSFKTVYNQFDELSDFKLINRKKLNLKLTKELEINTTKMLEFTQSFLISHVLEEAVIEYLLAKAFNKESQFISHYYFEENVKTFYKFSNLLKSLSKNILAIYDLWGTGAKIYSGLEKSNLESLAKTYTNVAKQFNLLEIELLALEKEMATLK